MGCITKLYPIHEKLKTLDFLSDVHLEFYTPEQVELKLFPAIFKYACSDTLIIAGDLCPLNYLEDYNLSYLSTIYKKVYYLFGNHDFYGTNLFEARDKIKKHKLKYPFITFILDQYYDIENKIAFFVNSYPLSSEIVGKKDCIADSRYIADWAKHTSYMYDSNQEFLTGLKEVDYVVTHYLPFEESIATQYKGSSINCFFLTDLEYKIDHIHPKFWIHGHTHSQCCYLKNNIAVWANPMGYPSENKELTVKNIFKTK